MGEWGERDGELSLKRADTALYLNETQHQGEMEDASSILGKRNQLNWPNFRLKPMDTQLALFGNIFWLVSSKNKTKKPWRNKLGFMLLRERNEGDCGTFPHFKKYCFALEIALYLQNNTKRWGGRCINGKICLLFESMTGQIKIWLIDKQRWGKYYSILITHIATISLSFSLSFKYHPFSTLPHPPALGRKYYLNLNVFF